MKKKLLLLLITTALVLFSVSVQALNWWNTDFTNRQPIQISGIHSLIDTNYTFEIALDTTPTNFALNDLNDLRVIFQDSNGDNIQLARDIDNPKDTNTIIRWKNYVSIAENVDLNGSDNNGYWIYYNNVSAGNPPKDWIDVYWFGDDFNRTNLTDAPYTEWTTHGVGVGESVGIVGHSLDLNGVVGASFGKAVLEDANWLYETSIAFDIMDANGNPPQGIQTGTASCNNGVLNTCTTHTQLTLGFGDGNFWSVGNAGGEGSIKPFAGSTANVFFDANILSMEADLNGWTEGSVTRVPSTKAGNAEAVSYASIMSGFAGFTFSVDWIKITKILFNGVSPTTGTRELLPSIVADFNTSPLPPYVLNQDTGIVSFVLEFNDTTTYYFGDTYSSTSWLIDDTEFSTDQNATRTFTTAGDFNITQRVTSTDGNFSQHEETITIGQAVQSIDINVFKVNASSSSIDVNFGVTATGTINYAVWGFPNDQNQYGLTASKNYTTGDTREVCVIVNGTGDNNKLHCENFFTTHIIVKIPKDSSNLNLITPFDVSIDSTPPQSFTGVSLDQNFWFFYQSEPDSNTHNIIIDSNVSFFLSNYFVGLNATDLNQTIQPYMVPVTDGINVIFTAKDSLTSDTVKGVVLRFNRTVSTDGDSLVESGVTDNLGRISLPFIVGIDHNFTIEFPFGTFLKAGTYIPQTIDATDGVTVLVPVGLITGDQNALGVVDINFLQNIVTVKANQTVDLNQTVSSTRPISSINITVDHNGVNLFNDTNSGNVATGGIFGQNIDVNTLNRDLPLIITFTFAFADGGTIPITKAVTLKRGDGLYDNFVNATDDLGGVGGTMILAAIIITIILGAIHYGFFPTGSDTSHTFLLAATILLFLSFVGWIDGVSWIIASLAGGAAYVLRRVPQ